MRRTVLADTGPIYAVVDPRDNRFERAREDVARLNAERLSVAVTYPILCESYSLILRRLGVNRAHGWLDEMRDQASFLNPSHQDYEAAASLISGYPDQALSIFDAVTAVVGQRLEMPVWTYDHHFDVMQVEVWRGD